MSHSNELLKNARVEAARADLESLVHWLNKKYTAITLPGDRRALMAIGCLDVALEHQMGIEVLARHGLYGSMLALVRVTFEALIRGIWLARCATDAELEHFRTHDEIRKGFETLVKEVEFGIGNTSQALLNLKKQSWGALNSFTHTGMMQITRRHAPGVTGPNYSVEDVLISLSGAGVFGLLVAIEMATIAGNKPLALETLERSKTFAARPSKKDDNV